jgi:hypothetical protein
MIEDKLRADQRIRLEAVAQANMCIGPRHSQPAARAIAELIAAAEKLAEYIAEGRS